ncbi:MAG: hypothetical protein KIT84_44300 [Labilithrix sp.]|nr:hypothetical protein [Labilithrix sp.]MCW5818101.1 hypothetical protein [Labilithrix sp.]
MIRARVVSALLVSTSMAGCGALVGIRDFQIDPPDVEAGTSDASEASSEACVDAEEPAPVAPGPTPATCAEVRAASPAAADGEYTLYARGDRARPWQAYCHDMEGTPAEYVPLVNTGEAHAIGDALGSVSSGAFVNYSQLFQEERGNHGRPTRHQLTFFDRVRVDPATLRVDVGDRRFARVVGAMDFLEAGTLTGLPYGTGAYCWESGNARGSGNVDLRGTPFAIADTAQFVKGGSDPGGEVVVAAGGQVVELHGGGGHGNGGGDGACGWMSALPPSESIYTLPAGRFQLALAHRALPRSCAEVLAQDPQAKDGERLLYVDNDVRRPWRAHCVGMAGGAPREYLTLVETGATSNFATYAAGGAAEGTDVTTRYERLRIDPVTLRIDVVDRTFASSAGSVMVGGETIASVPFGVAASCGGPGSATGSANVDLRGTPFAVAQDAFVTRGESPGGSATYRRSDRVVDVLGGGACGRSEPAPGRCDLFTRASSFQLRLIHRPLPRTCAELAVEEPTARDGSHTLHGVDGRAWTAYCADMQSATPREYLTVGGGDGRNYAQATASAGTGEWGGTNVVTRYERVRVDPKTFYVDESDRRFATSTGKLNFGLTELDYGNAVDCGYSFSDTGRANVDLRATPFAVTERKFESYGYLVGGSTTETALNQFVDLRGGGLCGRREPRPVLVSGSTRPSPSYRLGLVYLD